MTNIKVLFAQNPLPGLTQYAGPTLAITPTHGDTEMDLHNQSDIPHVRVEETSHWPQTDKPEEFNRILDAFLAEHVN